MKVDVNVTNVYTWLENSKARINVLRGGTGSSKSYSLSQFFILEKLLNQHNKTIVIARKTLPALKITAMAETMKLIKAWGIPHDLNQQPPIRLKVKDNVCYFISVDDADKIASLQTDDVWLEEMVDFNFEDFHQFNMRCNGQIYGSFNPVTALHWIKKILIDGGHYDIAENVSTFRDNPYLPQSRRNEIENLINIDQNFYNIYNLGQWGTLENVIYGKWQSLEIPEKYDEISYGIDWAFNNPSAILKCYWIDNKVIWEELFYAGGLTQDELVQKVLEVIPKELRKKQVFVDSSEPALIQALYDMGINSYKAKKDVNDGISYCKTHLLGVVKDSINLIKELNSYSWKKDKNDNVIDEPVKFMDHLMDAGRYATYSMNYNNRVTQDFDFSLR